MSGDAVLEVTGLSKHYALHAGLLRREVGCIRAVDGVSLTVRRGTTLALVGESGCGKTTASRCIVRALKPPAGIINFTPQAGGGTVDLAALPRRELRPMRRHMQMIFQDPYSSLNPRMVVGDIIAEPLILAGARPAERNRKVADLLDLVGLPAAARTRFPHAFSGGQRQRIGIARALALDPALVMADEPVSALDVSVQAQIVNLLLDVQDKLGLSMLFVANDLSVVKHVADEVAVMYLGRIVELAPTEALYRTPRHPYTETLMAAVPHSDPVRRTARTVPRGEVANPMKPPAGCAFHPRCAYAVDRCRTDRPELARLPGERFSACHRANELTLVGIGGGGPLASAAGQNPTKGGKKHETAERQSS